ncbi:MAG: hypothetical protein DDT37_00724 [Firmicutes bacterium]|nr:hypothetical protein [candidate division NPL-UPA2 bacterium]MBT9155756.1 hypothetical protein [candidate division NPL-UPA2 bacterium]
MSNRSRGQRGEELAAQYLVSQGYAIVCRNYRGERGEIDLIAFRHGLLLFAEVKYRQDLTQGHPAEAITLRKLARLRRTVVEYLASGEGPPFTALKFNAICIIELPGQAPQLELFEDILGP